MKTEKKRCWWCGDDPLYVAYHDEEWGDPVYDDQHLFEMLVLETFQAGLSWITILKKRENFRKAFKDFDPKKISRFKQQDIDRLMNNAGIIRNRSKIEAAVNNAKIFLEIQEENGSFSDYIWQFTDHKTLRTRPRPTKETIRATSVESDAMAKTMKKDGFKFVGSTTCYAYMQSIGMVDDHTEGCWKSKKPQRT